MVSTVGTRPNHYETLGLKPGASEEEIVRAFAREISPMRPRAFGGLAEVSLAYETLRDPAKRKAYDASLGLTPEPEPGDWRARMQFIASPYVVPPTRPVIDSVPGRSAKPAPQAPPKPTAEPRTASFIAASLRDPAEAEVRRDTSRSPRPEPIRRPEVQARPSFAPRPARAPAAEPMVEQQLDSVEVTPIEWKRTGATAGTLVVAVGLVGALAGWWSGREAEVPKQAERVTLALPPAAEARQAAASPALAPPPRAEDARREPRRRTDIAAVPIESAPSALQQSLTVQELEDLPPVDVRPRTSAIALAAAEPAAAEPAPAVAPTAASMPLPNRTIARTIQKIGYACGQVASTSPVEGSSGVFKVTCTSGQSYQARPVNGRYRFRRWQ